ncbi:MAG: hypothetical protein KDK25_12730, partial [Leptospiraceae bacterium]|nr:hypothetical protein [Leptospiraceae bacterium]
MFIIVLLYQILLHPRTVEYIVKTVVEARTRSSITLNIQRSSLIYGFIIHDLKVNTETGDPIVEIPELKLTWFLPGVLAGHAGIRELGIYDARVYVTEKDGVWNLDYLSTGQPAEKKTPKKPATKEPRESIDTYLPLKLYANLDIRNLQFHYSSQTEGQTLDASGLDIRLAFITNTFTSIPLNTRALDLFETLVVAINPYGPVRISYHNGNNLDGDLTLSFRFFRQTVDGQGIFSSLLNVDTTSLTLSRTGYADTNPGLVAQYQTSYNEEEDALLYRDFNVGYNGRHWLAFEARVNELTRERPRIELSMLRSEIDLNEPGRFLAMLTNGRIQLGGYLSVYPMSIRGPLDRMEFSIQAQGNGIFIRGNAGSHQVPTLDLKAQGAINLFEALPFLNPPESYDREAEKRKLAYGL